MFIKTALSLYGVTNMYNRKSVWLYMDGRKICDVLKAALDANVMLADMKKMLADEYKGHIVEFRVEVM